MKYLLCVLTACLFNIYSFGQQIRKDTLNFTDSNGLKQGHWILYWKDIDTLAFCRLDQYKDFRLNTKFEEGDFIDGKKEGLWIQYDAGGHISWKKQFKHGKVEGIYEVFYPSGILMETGYWKDGKQRGQNFVYYENGNLQYEGCHDSDAKLIGYSIQYYSNGIIKDISYRYNGKKEGYSLLYDSLGYEKSKKYFKAGIEIRDSIIFNVELDALKDLVKNKNHIIFKKQKLIALEIENKISKAEQEKKDVFSAQEKQRQQMIIYSISIILFFVTLFAIFIFRSYRQKQKANIEIIKQKRIIEEKQKEILASINYAKRIQESLLPTEKYIDRAVKRLQGK